MWKRMKPVLYSLLSNHHTTGTFFVFITLDATSDNEKTYQEWSSWKCQKRRLLQHILWILQRLDPFYQRFVKRTILISKKLHLRWLLHGQTINFQQTSTSGDHSWPVDRVLLPWKYIRRLVKLLLQLFSRIIMNKTKLNGKRHLMATVILIKESFIHCQVKY